MKKILNLILMLTIFCSVVSCKCNDNKKEPILLEDAQYTTEGKIEYLTSYDSIEEKINDKVNFALYIYASGCLSCAAFSPYINAYVDESKITLYALELSIFKPNNPEIGKLLKTPSVLIFKEGELYEYIAAHIENHSSYFESKDGFKEWFETYVIIK